MISLFNERGCCPAAWGMLTTLWSLSRVVLNTALEVMKNPLALIEDWCRKENLRDREKVNPRKTILVNFTRKGKAVKARLPCLFGEVLKFEEEVT